MDKGIIKLVVCLVSLVVIIGILLYTLIVGFKIGNIEVIPIMGIAEKKENINDKKKDLETSEEQNNTNKQTLESAKKEFTVQKEAYELISDETINAIREATKEEEYFIEYVWIVLGNYAKMNKLQLMVVEPNGTVSGGTSDNPTAPGENPDVSTGTGITADKEGNVKNPNDIKNTNNPNNANSQNPGTQTGQEGNNENKSSEGMSSGITSNPTALTVKLKGNYINLADFVFEVENDKSLRFKLDNIKMKSAGGTEVEATFNVKDFKVLKELKNSINN